MKYLPRNGRANVRKGKMLLSDCLTLRPLLYHHATNLTYTSIFRHFSSNVRKHFRWTDDPYIYKEGNTESAYNYAKL
jgi:hypothetical protein